MSNPFYTASGNPGTGSEGLSATMRAEFFSIQTAFDLVPRISTTGLFTTVFNQLGNYTFTLPAISGVLATTANITTETVRATAAEAANAAAITAEATARTTAVSAETTRALAAEAVVATSVTTERTRALAAEGVNATAAAAAQTTANAAIPKAGGTMTGALVLSGAPTVALNAATKAYVDAETTRALAAEGVNAADIATKQASLGYTPVQQGTGIGQGSNTIKIGYDGSNVKIKATVDVTDFGNIALEPWVTAAISAQFAVVHNVSGSRALSTTYTNTTGKIMFVTVQVIEPGSYIPNTVDMFIYINGVQSYYISTDSNHATATYGASGSVMVPPLSTYSVVSNAAAPVLTWMETY
jgi:hypothetical protein